MPIYAFNCEACGPFEELRPMADIEKPASCPDCSQLAERTVTAARLNLMQSNNRKANVLNEKSASEPRVVKAANRKGHSKGHACGSDHSASKPKGHLHTGTLPWTVGH